MVDKLMDTFRGVRFRGKARLFGRFLPSQGLREARVFGYQMTLDLAGHVGQMIYLGAYEREETELVHRWLRPGMTFLDVGANLGYFTLLASRRVGPSGRVIACEPSPSLHARLSETLRRNGLPVELHQIGLGDADAVVSLYETPESYNNPTPSMLGANGSTKGVGVPVRRLDDCLDAWSVPSVDLLKIDVEGYEPRVFAGAERSLASGRVRAILCEFNDYWLRQAGSSPDELHRTLTAHGFVDQAGAPSFAADCVDNRFFVHRKTGRG
ncbi:MAG: FkbM family methyltransferase [Isosphaeraceae bacterium]